MDPKRTCSDVCKKYRVTKPVVGGRYEAGHARCQTCDIWIDYRGAHTKDGSPATKDSFGLFCNCCNYRVRRNPRHTKYKTKMRQSDTKINDDVDMTHFNNYRAHMLRDLGRAIAQKEDDTSYETLLSNSFKIDIESEFETSLDVLVVLSRQTDPPNKVSMIAEFERIRHMLGHVPTKNDMGEHSKLDIAQYETKFTSWEYFLGRLGYDPWYRQEPSLMSINSEQALPEESEFNELDNLEDVINSTRKEIRECLKDKQDILKLFTMVDQNITEISVDGKRELIEDMRNRNIF